MTWIQSRYDCLLKSKKTKTKKHYPSNLHWKKTGRSIIFFKQLSIYIVKGKDIGVQEYSWFLIFRRPLEDIKYLAFLLVLRTEIISDGQR